VIDDHQIKHQLNNDAHSIYFNSVQGRKLNCGITCDLDTHDVFLFLLTKETDIFGRLLKNEFRADFMMLKFETPFKSFKSDQDMDDVMAHMAALAKSRELKL
jgi:hypothetical protein